MCRCQQLKQGFQLIYEPHFLSYFNAKHSLPNYTKLSVKKYHQNYVIVKSGKKIIISSDANIT